MPAVNLIRCQSRIIVLLLRRLPLFTRFPYTTLFRSRSSRSRSPRPPLSFRSSLSSGAAANCAGSYGARSEEHTSELQSLRHLVCRLLLEKKKHETDTHAE